MRGVCTGMCVRRRASTVRGQSCALVRCAITATRSVISAKCAFAAARANWLILRDASE
jgi:hypothetical protein